MIEFLEPRIAPAGLIDVSFSGGNLVLKSLTGDAGDETATITRIGADGITIAPGANVAIRYEGTTFPPTTPLTLAGFSGSLTAKLGGGNDSLVLDGGNYSGDVRIDLGDGTDVLEIRGGAINFVGKLTVSLGSGANQFALTASDFHASKGLVVKSGSGNDLLTFASAKLVIDGGLSVATGGGSDTVQFTAGIAELSVEKNLIVATSGSRSAIIEQSFSGIGKINIGGNLTLSAGTGDRVQQVLTGTTGTLAIGGDVAFSATNPTEHTQVLAGGGTLGGSLRMTSRAIIGTQTFSATTGTIAGEVTLRGGTSVVVDFGGTIPNDLSITTAKNSSANVALSSATIDGNVRIATKDGFGLSASIAIQDVILHGSLAVTGGIGATTLRVNQADIAKTFTVALKDGANRFLFEQEKQPGASIFRGDVNLTGGIDVDTFTIGGTADDSIQFLAAIIADGRAGIDTLTEGAATTHPAGASTQKINIP